jgi:hypothetical protein
VSARRYIAVVQAPGGYPGPDDPLEAAPPEGPAPPMLHTVVMEAEYEAIEKDRDRLRALIVAACESAELVMVTGGCNVPGYVPSVHVKFTGDAWSELGRESARLRGTGPQS